MNSKSRKKSAQFDILYSTCVVLLSRFVADAQTEANSKKIPISRLFPITSFIVFVCAVRQSEKKYPNSRVLYLRFFRFFLARAQLSKPRENIKPMNGLHYA